MQLGMSVGFRQDLRLEQSLRLTQAQRVQIRGYLFETRLALIESLREERYRPEAKCPRCERKLTPVEIIQGFNRDPNDFTTRCTGCSHRFPPSLICFGIGGNLELPFFCDSQTLEQLRGKESLSPEELSREYPAIYRSAIVHHGGIANAFAKIGITYIFEEIADWRSKVRPFLGRLPDTTIAECVHATPFCIRAMRKRLRVKPFSRRKALRRRRRRAIR